MDKTELWKWLNTIWSKGVKNTSHYSLETKIKNSKPKIAFPTAMEDLNSWATVIERSSTDEKSILQQDISQERHSLLIKYFLDHLKFEYTVLAYVRYEIEKEDRPNKISDFIDKIMTAGRNLQMVHNVNMICGFKVAPNNIKRSYEAHDSDETSTSSKRGRPQDGYVSDRSTRTRTEKSVSLKERDQSFSKPPACARVVEKSSW